MKRQRVNSAATKHEFSFGPTTTTATAMSFKPTTSKSKSVRNCQIIPEEINNNPTKIITTNTMPSRRRDCKAAQKLSADTPFATAMTPNMPLPKVDVGLTIPASPIIKPQAQVPRDTHRDNLRPCHETRPRIPNNDKDTTSNLNKEKAVKFVI